jgi:hypothetical protein
LQIAKPGFGWSRGIRHRQGRWIRETAVSAERFAGIIETRGRRQRLTGPTTVAGFYGGRPRYEIHGGAGSLTWPRLFGTAAKIAVLPALRNIGQQSGTYLRTGGRPQPDVRKTTASIGTSTLYGALIAPTIDSERAIANEAVAVDWPVPTGHLAATLTASPTLPQLES